MEPTFSYLGLYYLFQRISHIYGNHMGASVSPGGGGHFNFVCTGVCGYRIGKLTHPQTKAGPSINKNTPILRLFTTEID